MADIFVRHVLNFDKSVKFTITVRDFIDTSSEGDNIWTLEIGTLETDLQGDNIIPERLHVIAPEDTNLDLIIEKGLAQLASQIDWAPLVVDKEAPSLIDISPSGDNVSIYSNMYVKIKDAIPSAGIDLSNMKVTLHNGVEDFNITDDVKIEGGPFEYELKWSPSTRVLTKYE